MGAGRALYASRAESRAVPAGTRGPPRTAARGTRATGRGARVARAGRSSGSRGLRRCLPRRPMRGELRVRKRKVEGVAIRKGREAEAVSGFCNGCKEKRSDGEEVIN